MTLKLTDFLPDLQKWNDGDGIDPVEWAFITGKSDHLLGFASIFWPNLIEFEGMVLRNYSGVEDDARMRLTEGHTTQQIEQHLNCWDFGLMFQNEAISSELLEKRQEQLCYLLSEMLAVKLARDFPDRRFSVSPVPGTTLSTNDDLEVTFWQI